MGAFLYLVQSGRLAQVKRGFLISLVLAVAGTAFVSASLLGAWAWTTARAVIFQLVIRDLQHVGDVTEASLSEAVTLAFGELSGDAREIATRLASTHPEKINEELEIIIGSNKRLVQADLVDRQGRLLAESSTTGAKEPLNATGVTYALQGKEFVSDPYFSAAFNRYVLYLATPVLDQNNVVRPALTSRYDLQEGLQNVFKRVRFGQTGYAVLVDGNGHIVAHPNSERVRDNISSYAAVQRALSGESGWLTAANDSRVDRLYFYRPF